MLYDKQDGIAEQVADGDIVYDVAVVPDGQQLYVEARYNSEATAENYDRAEDVHGTGPVMEHCRDTIHVIGTPPGPDEIRENLDEYFDRLKDEYWHDTRREL